MAARGWHHEGFITVDRVWPIMIAPCLLWVPTGRSESIRRRWQGANTIKRFSVLLVVAAIAVAREVDGKAREVRFF
jgi:hypothetical protein